jgi:predicted ATPase
VRGATEGNPFFIGEIVHALDDDRDPEAALTPRVRDGVRWRLARLPRGTAEVLTAAAVAGAEFDAGVVAGATDVALERALDALDAAERARLVRPAGHLDRFAFAHALMRDTIVDELPAGRRVRLHARIAHALQRAAATRSVPSSDLAAHFAAAGTLVDATQTYRYTREAGDEAVARLAFDVAAEQYERAVRALHRLATAPRTSGSASSSRTAAPCRWRATKAPTAS